MLAGKAETEAPKRRKRRKSGGGGGSKGYLPKAVTALGGFLVAGLAGAGVRVLEDSQGERAGKIARGAVVGAGLLAELTMAESGLKSALGSASKGVIGALGDKIGGEAMAKVRASQDARAMEQASATARAEAERIREEMRAEERQEQGEPVAARRREREEV